MREIKFRGKNTFNNRWEYGSLVKEKDGALWIIPEDQMLISEGESFSAAHVSSETVGEFTGQKDKNGVEIYEGDIVETVFPYKYAVEFSDGAFIRLQLPRMKHAYSLIKGWAKVIRVIGNIHDNPELIK